MNRKRKSLLFVSFALGLAPALYAQIQGSAHDFSQNAWSGNKICIVCHTPHGANLTIPNSPLWNRESSGVVYALYSSPTMDVPVEQPGPASLVCLSCHDGVLAVDNYGGNTGGTVFVTGNANIGTDLSDDHPIGIQWEHQTGLGDLTCSNCHNMTGGSPDVDLPFFNRVLECATCHDVHNTMGLSFLLRDSMNSSSLCLRCHAQ